MPIERYVTSTRPDGYSIDPWIRVHQRLGGRLATPLRRSLRISGTVGDRETWTGLLLPESGDYDFPRGQPRPAPSATPCAVRPALSGLRCQ